ncbi:MAG: DUF6624 domain-containing protein [Bacteroidota bacterium]
MYKPYFLCFCLLLAGTSLTLAQTFSSTDPAYKENVTAGEEALKNEAYQECLDFYATAFKIKQTSFLSTLRAAACAHSAGEEALRDQYLDHAFTLDAGGTNRIFKEYPEFEYLAESPFAKMVSDRFLAAFPDLDPELMEKLAEVRRTDQEQRGLMREFSEKYGWQSPQMDSLWAIQNESDSLNTIYVTQLIDERGYPGKSMVGDQAGTAFLVIQHADLAVQEKYLPVLRAAAEAGELRWSSLALLIDRVEMRNDRPQVYGSQVSRDPETNEHFFAPIAQPYKVDSLRATVGLGPLTEYAQNWDFSYDPDKHVARHQAKTKED